MATWAHDHNVAVFYITGRPASWHDATVANLEKAGYPTPDGVYFEPGSGTIPPYLKCAATCTTVQYKSGTRAYLESQGYDVLATVGDQDSDLQGGHADAAFKLPNPQYVTP